MIANRKSRIRVALTIATCAQAIAFLSTLMSCTNSATKALGNTKASSATETIEAPPPKPEPVVDLPRTPGGQLARALVDVVNGGKLDAQREFTRTRFSAKGLADVPVEEGAGFLQRMWTQSGGIDVVEVFPTKMANRVAFLVRSRHGRHFAKLDVVTNASADRIDAFFCQPMTDPAVPLEPGIAAVPMAENEIVRVIEQRADRLARLGFFSGTLLVVKGDRVLVSLSRGEADKSFGVPNAFDTKFNLASMNKMFTAVAIGQLVEQGKMAFTDSLAKVLPDYPDRAFAERATVHHLLTHTSGLYDEMPSEALEHRDRFRQPIDYLPFLAREKQLFPSGERFSYSSPGFIVLGAVVEQVSGERYDDYVERHIFQPAGMRDTRAYELDEVVPNRAVGYRMDDGDPFGLMPRRSNILILPLKGTPAGGGYSTVRDIRAFAEALRGHRLLGAAMTETVSGSKVESYPGYRYGYGFQSRVTHRKEVRGHSGVILGVHTSLNMLWDGSYTVITLCNVLPPAKVSHFADEIVDLLAAQSDH